MTDNLIEACSKQFGKTITHAKYETEPLHGGTLGDVRLFSGIATTVDGIKLPFKLVLKTQKKWERHGDPNSWRREYDLYTSNLAAAFTNSLLLPKCYHAQMNSEENEIQLWLEYIDGVSGLYLTGEMYELAAYELGRLQGKLYVEQPACLQSITNLSDTAYLKNFYFRYRLCDAVYNYIRSEGSEIPVHLCEMLIDFDNRADEIFDRIEKLPMVLCHRDFWVANIFCTDNKIVLIDWDTSGWGFLGEDIASLLADEAVVENMVTNYMRCIPAYYKGFSEYTAVSGVFDNCIYEMILALFGYRIVEYFLCSQTEQAKILQMDTLQQIYEMGNFARQTRY